MLAKSRVGATGSDEDDNQSQTSNHDSLFGKEDCYQVIGTLKDDFSPKPDWVNTIIDVSFCQYCCGCCCC